LCAFVGFELFVYFAVPVLYALRTYYLYPLFFFLPVALGLLYHAIEPTVG
jgi:hypothetical protein